MRRLHNLAWLFALIGLHCASPTFVQAQMAPVFTYQGQLKEAGSPYDGTAYLEFSLWDAPELGTQIGSPYWTFDGVNVVNGLFTVEVDAMLFGPTAFNGHPRWLQVVVTDWNYFERVELSPRQAINPAPYALYSFDAAGGGGGSVWQTNGSDVYYSDGNVGVGTTSPSYPLHVSAYGGSSIYGENDAAMGRGIRGEGTAEAGSSVGVEGRAVSTNGTGVSGYASSRTGTTYGVVGSMRSPDGAGVYGHNFAAEGGKAVYGWCARTDGFAGYFEGAPSYFSHNVGIGTTNPGSTLTANGVIESEVGGFKFPDGTIQTTAGGGGGTTLWSQSFDDSIVYNDGYVGIWMIGAPTAPLEVGGTIKMNGIQIGTTATAGYVLTTNSNGIGTWQPGGGGGNSFWTADTFGVNYQGGNVGIGAASTSGNALNVRSAGSRTLNVLNTTASGYVSAVWGEVGSTTGRAVFGYATSDSGTATGVHGESTSPDGFGVEGHNDDDSGDGEAVGVRGTSGSESGVGVKGSVYAPSGYGVYGYNEATSGNAVGVFGQTGTASGFGGYFVGRGYFSSSVGIGTASTSSPLTVAGTIQSLSGGFKFPDGSVQTTAATGSGLSLWQTNGSEIYYYADNVGVGVTDPQSRLHVVGGNWDVANTEGDFKIGTPTYRLKIGVATSGGGAGTCRIFAAGPSSRLVLGVSGQDRLSVTSTNVDVIGPIEVDGFKLNTAPAMGYVLTSDALGNGTWQPGGGGGGDFALPLDRTVTYNGDAFKITNSGTSILTHAITGIINNATSSEASAGRFSAVGSGMAIKADTDGGTTIYAHNSGVGKAIHASTNGSGGGYFSTTMAGGYGVKGTCSSTTANDESRGGWFTASGNLAIGVDAEGQRYGVKATTPKRGGIAVRAEATGDDSTGVFATSPNVGLWVQGGEYAATFKGEVVVYPSGLGDQIFAVKNDGTTQVDILQIMGGADLSERFDVKVGETKAEPGMVVSIDAKNPGMLVVSESPYDRKVAGIISGAGGIKTGMMMGQKKTIADGAYPVALTGRVYVWADASNGPIEPGDLLTTSNVAGHAMRVTVHAKATGATLGKAMTALEEGRGLVLVLVSLQ